MILHREDWRNRLRAKAVELEDIGSGARFGTNAFRFSERLKSRWLLDECFSLLS
jgi:hypothetical protein